MGMMAYALTMFLVLMNSSIIVVGALEVYPSFADEDALNVLNDPIGDMVNVAAWDWRALVMSGTGVLALIGSLAFHLPVGATVFAGTFAFMNGATANMLAAFEQAPYSLMPEITSTIMVAMTFIFLFAFIQLSSTGTGN